ncbi:uncharacterized mitochondrial protein-like protein [Tanacetum coccineum]
MQWRQSQSFAGNGSQSNATSTGVYRNVGNNAGNQTRVICCYNYRGKGHMARQCTQPKRPKNANWFKKKILLVHAHESWVVLDAEQLAFLVDPRISEGQYTQTTLPINVAFQTDDHDAFDSNCDEAPFARVVLMANLSSYDLDVLLNVPILDTFQDNIMLDHCVQEMYYSEQPAFDHFRY